MIDAQIVRFAIKVATVTIAVILVLLFLDSIYDAEEAATARKLCYYGEGYYTKGAYLSQDGVHLQCAAPADDPDGPVQWIRPR